MRVDDDRLVGVTEPGSLSAKQRRRSISLELRVPLTKTAPVYKLIRRVSYSRCGGSDSCPQVRLAPRERGS